MQVLESSIIIGPYIRRTKLFDDFSGYISTSFEPILIRIFPFMYNIERIIKIHQILEKSECTQVLYQEEEKEKHCYIKHSGILVFKYYPRKNLLTEPIPESKKNFFYIKAITTLIDKGRIFLEELKEKKIIHHDICLDNIYFDCVKPDEFDFKILNWTFATINDHNASIKHRYPLNERFYKDDPYKHDRCDFALAVLSLINKNETIENLIEILNEITEDKWVGLLIPYHKNKEEYDKVKKFFMETFPPN